MSDIITTLITTQSPIDPTLLVPGEALWKGTLLKRVREKYAGCAVAKEEKRRFAICGRVVWMKWLWVQLDSLERMVHTGWQMREIDRRDGMKERRMPVVDFIEKIRGLVRDEEGFERRFGFEIRSGFTMELVSLLKVYGEGVLICGDVGFVIVRASHTVRVRENGRIARRICERVLVEGGVRYGRGEIGGRGGVGIGVVAICVLGIVGVIVGNPGDRRTLFAILADCMLVIMVCMSIILGIFGGARGVDAAERFTDAVFGYSKWEDEDDIVKDIGVKGVNCLKIDLTNGPCDVNRQIWKNDDDGLGFCTCVLLGYVRMKRAWLYDPDDFCASCIVGNSHAFNFVTHHVYHVVTNKRHRTLIPIDYPSHVVIIGLQTKAYIN